MTSTTLALAALPYVFQGSNIVVVLENTPHTISKSHVNFKRVTDAIKAGDWAKVAAIIDPVKTIVDNSDGHVNIKGTQVWFDGRELHGALATRLVAMIDEGFSIQPLVKFLQNLENNPSKRAVEELYGFLEKNNLPITENGKFLAYKKVKQNYKDLHSGTVLNKPAGLLTEAELASMPIKAGRIGEVTIAVVDGKTVVSMPRNKVNDNANDTCSDGLHFCSIDYLKHFGGERVMILEIDPADVVSIPTDYNNSKGRCSKYAVVSEMGVKATAAFDKAVQNDANATESESEGEVDAWNANT